MLGYCSFDIYIIPILLDTCICRVYELYHDRKSTSTYTGHHMLLQLANSITPRRNCAQFHVKENLATARGTVFIHTRTKLSVLSAQQGDAAHNMACMDCARKGLLSAPLQDSVQIFKNIIDVLLPIYVRQHAFCIIEC